MIGLRKDVMDIVDKQSSQFQKVFKECLKVKTEEILIISDYGVKDYNLASMMGYGFYQAAKSKGYNVNMIFQDVKKSFMHVDDHVKKALELLPEKNAVIVACLSNKLGKFGVQGSSFRRFCKEKGYRFISSTGLGAVSSANFPVFMESISINYKRLQKKGLKIKDKLDKGNVVRVKTKAGTDVTLSIKGSDAIANVGNYKECGAGGNIPTGEVYIAPEGFTNVNGTLVIDGSLRHSEGTELLRSPVVVDIKDGRVVGIHGEKAHLLEKSLQIHEDRAKYPERVRLIGEFGIGINPGAVLIGSTILDEKVLGTAHIAIGSNYWFGGPIRTIFHADQVFKDPVVFIDGKKLEV
tara:strand:+ start:693 stop:1745 length:1053 start_codon:yes stop_codon:yes gene_type:complete